jgi:hypothetical protein
MNVRYGPNCDIETHLVEAPLKKQRSDFAKQISESARLYQPGNSLFFQQLLHYH